MRHILILVSVLSVLGSSAVSRAAVFTVSTSLDLVDTAIGDGLCRSSEGQMCSLRAAIQESNAIPGADVIVLQNLGPYQLRLQEPGVGTVDEDGSATGDLDVATAITVQAPAAASQRRIQVVFHETLGPPEDRIFHVLPAGNLTLRGVSLEDGVATSASTSRGGAILNEGILDLADCTLDGNDALEGGAIYNDGFLAVDSCTFSSNDARDVGGGAGDGGAIFSSTFKLMIVTGSTFVGNGADGRGGAVFSDFGSITDLENSTFSGNTGPDVLRFEDLDQFELTHLTIHGNAGTGIVTNLAQTTFRGIESSIVSGSSLTDCSFLGSVSPTSTTSLASDGSCGFAADGGFDSTDPELGLLADNGGATLTHLPAVTSLAVDHAAFSDCPLEDQRGTLRPDGDGGLGECDIGAVELLPEPGRAALGLAALLGTSALARRLA